MKKIIEYLPLLSGCLIYFGFCHLYHFYKEFQIDIYSLISSTDILLSFFPKIVVIASLLYGAIFSQLYESIRHPTEKEEDEVSSNQQRVKFSRRINWWRKNIPWFVLFYYFPASIFLSIIAQIYNHQPDVLYSTSLIIDFIFMMMFWIAIIIHEKKSSIFRQPIILGICLIIFIGHKIGTYRKYDAQMIKSGMSEFQEDHITFSFADSIVRTNDSILYVGAVSNYIFLYNLHDSATTIYPISEIRFLKVK